MFRLIVLGILLTPALQAGNFSSVTGFDYGVCALDLKGFHCYKEDLSTEIEISHAFHGPFEIYASPSVQCVKDLESVWCWQWREGAPQEPQRLDWAHAFTQIHLSSDYLCGLERDITTCRVLPWAKAGLSSYSWKDGELAVPGEGFICSGQRGGEEIACSVYAESAPFQIKFTSTSLDSLYAYGKNLCHASTEGGIICHNLSSFLTLPSAKGEQWITEKSYHFTFPKGKYENFMLTKTSICSHTDCGSLTGDTGRRFSRVPKEDYRLSELTPLQLEILKTANEGSFSLVPFKELYGVVLKSAEKNVLHLSNKDLILEEPNSFDLSPQEFSKSLLDVSNRTTFFKSKVFFEMSEALKKDPNNILYQFFMVAMEPIVESISSPYLTSHLKPWYKKALSEVEINQGVTSLLELKENPELRQTAVRFMFIALNAMKDELPEERQRESLKALILDLGRVLATSESDLESKAIENFMLHLSQHEPVFDALLQFPRTHGVTVFVTSLWEFLRGQIAQ